MIFLFEHLNSQEPSLIPIFDLLYHCRPKYCLQPIFFNSFRSSLIISIVALFQIHSSTLRVLHSKNLAFSKFE
ncbi:unnamed protein product [Blepharisma stoltei]|uniref:Uncharacterized protein n=1 Tax=Blepharisma stoltei TaxID=1481888 RepID=A0AAU9IWB2_9CILI|nr:unnamed protein product [Blepharisma stoltei]